MEGFKDKIMKEWSKVGNVKMLNCHVVEITVVGHFDTLTN